MAAESVITRQSAPANQPWLKRLYELLQEQLDERLRAGFHGTLTFEVSIRDGIIQGIKDSVTANHRI